MSIPVPERRNYGLRWLPDGGAALVEPDAQLLVEQFGHASVNVLVMDPRDDALTTLELPADPENFDLDAMLRAAGLDPLPPDAMPALVGDPLTDTPRYSAFPELAEDEVYSVGPGFPEPCRTWNITSARQGQDGPVIETVATFEGVVRISDLQPAAGGDLIFILWTTPDCNPNALASGAIMRLTPGDDEPETLLADPRISLANPFWLLDLYAVSPGGDYIAWVSYEAADPETRASVLHIMQLASGEIQTPLRVELPPGEPDGDVYRVDNQDILIAPLWFAEEVRLSE